MKGKQFVKWFTPPILMDAARAILSRQKRFIQEYEYIPEGWSAADSNPKIKGWDVAAVLAAYQKNWPAFLESLEGRHPFGHSPEANENADFDLIFHNTIMVYAYSLALASRQKSRVKMLDWGGGNGHYYLLAQKLIPGLEIDYVCKDVPILANYGKTLFPQATFLSDARDLQGKFDFILASCSLHYSQDWQVSFRTMASCLDGFMLITRLPITTQSGAYVYLQRPYRYGYDTEYLGWALNRGEFLDVAYQNGLHLVREFVTGEVLPIKNAPGPCHYRAYLFSKRGDSQNG